MSQRLIEDARVCRVLVARSTRVGRNANDVPIRKEADTTVKRATIVV